MLSLVNWRTLCSKMIRYILTRTITLHSHDNLFLAVLMARIKFAKQPMANFPKHIFHVLLHSVDYNVSLKLRSNR